MIDKESKEFKAFVAKSQELIDAAWQQWLAGDRKVNFLESREYRNYRKRYRDLVNSPWPTKSGTNTS